VRQTQRVTIINELGLHARAAAKLVHIATKHTVEVQIGTEEMMVNAKSIMGVLMLAAAKGTDLEVVAEGDEVVGLAALSAIAALIGDRFGEPT
jgi:phosphocarrier protein HPr